MRERNGGFVVGSPASNMPCLPKGPPGIRADLTEYPAIGPVDRLAVVSGRVSATPEMQIGFARGLGFDGVALDPVQLVAEHADEAIGHTANAGLASLSSRRSRYPLHRGWGRG